MFLAGAHAQKRLPGRWGLYMGDISVRVVSSVPSVIGPLEHMAGTFETTSPTLSCGCRLFCQVPWHMSMSTMKGSLSIPHRFEIMPFWGCGQARSALHGTSYSRVQS